MLVFGASVTAGRGLVTQWDVNVEVAHRKPVSEFVRQLDQSLITLLAASHAYRYDNLRAEPDRGPSTEFGVGQWVLLRWPNRRPWKLGVVGRGPYVIDSKEGSNSYLLRDPVNGFLITVDVSRLIKWRDTTLDEVRATQIRKDVAMLDVDTYAVDCILDFRLIDPRKRIMKTNLEFLVHWLEEPAERDSWESYIDCKDLAALDVFAATPRLQGIL
jgi:hypothetical protein